MIRILLADDHAMFRQGLVRLLLSADDVEIVSECGDGQAALTRIRELRPDVAVLDISMPVMDGLSVTRQVTQEVPGTSIVILTMHDSQTVRQQAEAAGARAFVLKDDAFEQLLATIRRVADCKPATFRKSQTPNPAPLPTGRELQVLRLVAGGLTNRAISEQLGISIKTVDSHRTNLMKKLDLHTTAELVRYAITSGVV